jgi:hypothetical protein
VHHLVGHLVAAEVGTQAERARDDERGDSRVRRAQQGTSF